MSTHSELPGVRAIEDERVKAISKGYNVTHDLEEHSIDELLRIAACYMEAAASDMEGESYDWPHPFWPEDSNIPPVMEDSPMKLAIRGAQFAAAAIDMIYAEIGAEKL